MVKGNDIIILVNGTAVAGCKTQRLQTTCGSLEKASSTQQEWNEYVAGRAGWTITVNKLVTLVDDIREVLKIRDTVTIVMRDRANTKSLTGTAIVTACDTTYTKGSLATGSYSFLGTGPLT
jgi:NAD(P)H-nitrite reductase large subunit